MPVTNSCRYCINSHTAAVQKLGLNPEGYTEVLAVIGLYNQMNKLVDALQIEPDILPEPFPIAPRRRHDGLPCYNSRIRPTTRAGESMSESSIEVKNRVALPLLPVEAEREERPASANWHGWSALTTLPDSPEPRNPKARIVNRASESPLANA